MTAEPAPATAPAGPASPAGRALPQRALLERIVEHARATPEIQGLLLFGSFAGGTEDVHSDLDIGLYVEDEAFLTFDLRGWLEPVAPVAAIYVDAYCSTVIFDNLVRAEVHLGSPAAADAWPPLAGVIAYPNLERMVLLDRSGRFAESVAPLIGRLPPRDAVDGVQAVLGLVNGLLVAEGCRRRGDLARALAHLGQAQVYLLRLARLSEVAFDEWVAPERNLARDLSTEAYERYAEATARLDPVDIRRAIELSWRWGRELAATVDAQQLDAATFEALDDRLAGPLRPA